MPFTIIVFISLILSCMHLPYSLPRLVNKKICLSCLQYNVHTVCLEILITRKNVVPAFYFYHRSSCTWECLYLQIDRMCQISLLTVVHYLKLIKLKRLFKYCYKKGDPCIICFWFVSLYFLFLHVFLLTCPQNTSGLFSKSLSDHLQTCKPW